MSTIINFYLSQVIGGSIFSNTEGLIGKIIDLVADMSSIRPKIVGVKIRIHQEEKYFDFSKMSLVKKKNSFMVFCHEMKEIQLNEHSLFLVKQILDKQIVDINGRKLVRVNDLRLALLSSGAYVVAVDVGIKGLLRRLFITKPLRNLTPLWRSIPGELILWDEVGPINLSHNHHKDQGLKLSKEYNKLHLMHPGDLADIIEDLDRKTQAAVFATLDTERAADVLEELEPEAQANVLEHLPIEKAVDVLEEMPVDEVADILDELEGDKAEALLNEMEPESSVEVRELMEYPANTVGSLMTTDYISFHPEKTVQDVLVELRKLKPDSETLYNFYVLDHEEHLVALVALRDLLISDPDTKLNQIMNNQIMYVHDDDKIHSLSEIITKYNLLAIPVLNHDMKMLGMVVIDDVVYELIRRKKKV